MVSIFAFFILQAFHIFETKYLFHIILLSAISSISSVHSSLLLGQQRLKAFNLVQILVPLVTFSTCVGQLFVYQQLDYTVALYVSYLVALWVSCLAIWRFFPQQVQEKVSRKMIWQRLFKLGFYNQLAHVLQLLSFRASYYILEQFHGTSKS